MKSDQKKREDDFEKYSGKYRTRANKGRADYSKIIFSTLRLSHKKDIKNVF